METRLLQACRLCTEESTGRFKKLDWDWFDRGFAAILLPLFPSNDLSSSRLLFTERSKKLSRHAGQICFPGGMIEKGETPEQAALREFKEEVKIADKVTIKIIGELGMYPNRPSRLRVYPFLAMINAKEDQLGIQSPDEVESLFTVGLADLKSPVWTTVHPDWPEFPEYYFKTEKGREHRIWGMTAYIVEHLISNLYKLD